MKKIELFTDGACSGNPGLGGWGAVLRYRGVEKEVSGAEEATTNNRMELKAVIESLKLLKEPCEVDLTTDSQYVMKGATEWMPQWVKNSDLWQEVFHLQRTHKLHWHWVKGHAGHPENERCDELARNAIADLRDRLA